MKLCYHSSCCLALCVYIDIMYYKSLSFHTDTQGKRNKNELFSNS